jgi:TM2 domain-containing membrane protein YozV
MKGKILDFNIQNSSGVISGDDGSRYNFSSSEWKSDKSPTANQIVDFTVDGENATGIYLDKNVALSDGKSRIAAALLALFLGWLGVHKFYLGQILWGFVYLVFCWTFIPAIIAFIEFILFLVMSDEKFDQKYNLENS